MRKRRPLRKGAKLRPNPRNKTAGKSRGSATGGAGKAGDRSFLDNSSLIRGAPLRIMQLIEPFHTSEIRTYLLLVVRELLRQGASVTVVGNDGNELIAWHGLGCPIYRIDFAAEKAVSPAARSRLWLDMLKAVITAEQIDIVHGHLPSSGDLLLKAAEQMNIAAVFTVHEMKDAEQWIPIRKRCASLMSSTPAVKSWLKANGIPSVLIPAGLHLPEFAPYEPFYCRHIRQLLSIPEQAAVFLYIPSSATGNERIKTQIHRSVFELQSLTDRPLHLLIAGQTAFSQASSPPPIHPGLQVSARHIPWASFYFNRRAYYSISSIILGSGRAALEGMAAQRPVVAVGDHGIVGLLNKQRFVSGWGGWFGEHAAPRPFDAGELNRELRLAYELAGTGKEQMLEDGLCFVQQRFHIADNVVKLTNLYQQSVMSAIEAQLLSMQAKY